MRPWRKCLLNSDKNVRKYVGFKKHINSTKHVVLPCLADQDHVLAQLPSDVQDVGHLPELHILLSVAWQLIFGVMVCL